jgi:hypothetical protein
MQKLAAKMRSELDIQIQHLIEMILLFIIQLSVHFVHFVKEYIKMEIVLEYGS